MATTTLRIQHGWDIYQLTADFAEASSPIRVDGDATSFRVADARHDHGRACELVAEWLNLGDGWEWVEDKEPETVPAEKAFGLERLDMRGIHTSTLAKHARLVLVKVKSDDSSFWVDPVALSEQILTDLYAAELAARYARWCREWGAEGAEREDVLRCGLSEEEE